MNIEYDKKKLIILRAVLIAIGAVVGGTALWQYFLYYPQVMRQEFRIIIIVVSAAFFAAMLGLSAKAFYKLGMSIAELFGSILQRLGRRGIVGVICGLLSAGIAVFVFDVVIRSTHGLWAVRLLVDILVYIVFAAICCYLFTRWLSKPRSKTPVRTEKVGYLLSAECLTDERSLVAARSLLNVKVCDGAYKALLLLGSEPYVAERLGELISTGTVGVIRSKKDFSDPEEYAAIERRLAATKRLRLVCKNGAEEDDVALNTFALDKTDSGQQADE